jgi:hypothetical protein
VNIASASSRAMSWLRPRLRYLDSHQLVGQRQLELRPRGKRTPVGAGSDRHADIQEVAQRVQVFEDLAAHCPAHQVALAAAERHRRRVDEPERLVPVDLLVLDRGRVAEHPVLGRHVDLGV